MTCGNLYAKCVHRSGRRRPRPNLLTPTAGRSSAEFTREKSHQLQNANKPDKDRNHFSSFDQQTAINPTDDAF